MEIYKDLSSPALKEFESLLNSQLSKIKIEEGKVIDGRVNGWGVGEGDAGWKVE